MTLYFLDDTIYTSRYFDMKEKTGMNSEYAKIFKALSEPKRLDVLDLLRDGEQCACVLLDSLDFTQSGLSYHMKILVESGIVSSRQDGKWVYYSISEEGRDRALDILNKIATPNSFRRAHCE